MAKKGTRKNELSRLQQAEAGGKTREICRKLGNIQATFYNWRKQYAGLACENCGNCANFGRRTIG